MKTLMLSNIPPRLKGKIARRADKDNSNMNDVLGAILADSYGLPFTPTGSRRVKPGASARVLLELPDDLKAAIKAQAQDEDDTLRNVAMRIICSAFGVKFEPTGRWRAAA